MIAWGNFAREIGLISGIESVKLNQKVYDIRHRRKYWNFGSDFVWREAFARHQPGRTPTGQGSGGSGSLGAVELGRLYGCQWTLKRLSWAEARIVSVLERVSQPFLDSELSVLGSQGRGLQYDGDLTGLPVSNTSRTYPNAAYGHMSDEIRLGYQAGMVSVQSPTYGRLWLSVEHHAGDTVSCKQAEALVLAAENAAGNAQDDVPYCCKMDRSLYSKS